jgi:hypothetical protein
MTIEAMDYLSAVVQRQLSTKSKQKYSLVLYKDAINACKVALEQPLTRDWKETIDERIARDSEFKEALEQPAQEPVAIEFNKIHELLINVWNREISADDALYEIECLNITPPHQDGTSPSKWTALTDDEIRKVYFELYDSGLPTMCFAHAIEQALKEKNT